MESLSLNNLNEISLWEKNLLVEVVINISHNNFWVGVEIKGLKCWIFIDLGDVARMFVFDTHI